LICKEAKVNDFIELKYAMTIVLRRWWLLIVLTIIAAAVGYLVSIRQPSVYQATATILIGQTIQSADLNRTDIQTSEALALTYANLTLRQPILQRVIDSLNLGISWRNLRNRIQAEPIAGTQLLEISVEGESPESARVIANEVANQLILLSPKNSLDKQDESYSTFNRQQIEYLQEKILSEQKRIREIDIAMHNIPSAAILAELRDEQVTLERLNADRQQNYLQLVALANKNPTPNSLTVIEQAQANNSRIRPRVQLNTSLSGVVGFIVAVVFAFLLDYFDDTYKSLADFYQSLNLTVFGVIGKIQGKKDSDKLITQLGPFSPIVESYRMIRSRIDFKMGNSSKKSIVVVSPMPREGKSITAANLAIVTAQAGLKTILVDADLRRPSVHQIFGVDNEIGMTDLLRSQKIKVNDCLKKTYVDNLQIITSGKQIPDTTERLATKRLSELVTELKKVSDVVIFDSAPALLVADTVLLSNQVDGVVLLIQAGKSKRRLIQQTIWDMEKAKANLLGCIVNQPRKNNAFSMYGPDENTSMWRKNGRH
jgi:capsular exopolysaccharide synthesis family protein